MSAASESDLVTVLRETMATMVRREGQDLTARQLAVVPDVLFV